MRRDGRLPAWHLQPKPPGMWLLSTPLAACLPAPGWAVWLACEQLPPPAQLSCPTSQPPAVPACLLPHPWHLALDAGLLACLLACWLDGYSSLLGTPCWAAMSSSLLLASGGCWWPSSTGCEQPPSAEPQSIHSTRSSTWQPAASNGNLSYQMLYSSSQVMLITYFALCSHLR